MSNGILIDRIRLTRPLIIASDAGSVYEPHPMLTYRWDPDTAVAYQPLHQHNGTPFDLGPHPADPNGLSLPSATDNHPNGLPSPNAQTQHVPGHEIWVYGGVEGFVETSFNLLNRVSHACGQYLYILAILNPNSLGSPRDGDKLQYKSRAGISFLCSWPTSEHALGSPLSEYLFQVTDDY